MHGGPVGIPSVWVSRRCPSVQEPLRTAQLLPLGLSSGRVNNEWVTRGHITSLYCHTCVNGRGVRAVVCMPVSVGD